MKRQLSSDATHSESDESRVKSRRLYESGSREGEEEPGGFLDLNATPLGFDLNAPVTEEDSPHQPSDWVPAKEKQDEAWRPAQEEVDEKDDTAESKPLVVENAAASQVTSKIEVEEPTKLEKLDSPPQLNEPKVGNEEREAEDLEEIKKDSDEQPELKPLATSPPEPSVPAPAVFQRSLESISTLGIDDDLDILRSVWKAHEQNDLESLDCILVEACEELAKNPFSPSRYHYLSCLYISKKLPEAFALPKTLKVLLGFFRSPSGGQSTLKRQPMLPIVASKLLNRAFASEPQWPLDFVQIYLEDAAGARSWIEHEGSKEFVANILTAFPDVDADSSASPEDSSLSRLTDSHGGSGEVVSTQTVKIDPTATQVQGTVHFKNRYLSEEIRAQVRSEFTQALNQLLGSASTKDNPRQLLKLLMQGAGYEEVRVVASSMIEAYLNNTVHLRGAKPLLDRIVQHTRSTSDNDCTTVHNLLALRITSLQAIGQIKPLHGNIFADMVTQLVRRRAEYATLALKTFVTAEVSSKNPHNLKSIVVVLKAMPESPPPEHELASIFQELAANEEYRFQLKDLIRRMMKQVGSDLDVHALCHGLLQPSPAMAEQHETVKEAWLKQLVDMACQLLLYAVQPFAMDENVVSLITSSPASSFPGPVVGSLKEKLSQLEKFSQETANFQIDAMAWCMEVLAVYLPSMEEAQFTRIVRQLLFLENSEVYLSTSESASEADLLSLRLLSFSTAAPEEILARLILMAISNFPFSQGEALNIIERLVWRAAALKRHFDGALTAASTQLPAAIFKLASLNLPGQSSLQQLVKKDVYWRACLVVLIIAVYNVSTIGWFVWENLPTIRLFMEALLTCTRTFLPTGGDGARILATRKLELEAEQRDSKAEGAISAYFDVIAEKRRNDPSSSEVNTPGSLLSPPGAGDWRGGVMFLEPTGTVRRPPKSVVEELDKIDEAFQLGHILRNSQDPNFLAEITKSQTLAQVWSWLQKILVAEPEVITCLPPVWQCELLFMHEGQHQLIRDLFLDIGKLRSHLHLVMVQQLPDKESEIERVVNFLSSKLISKSGSIRSRARRCFGSLFFPPPCSVPDVTQSGPSSPLDFKRTDASGSAAVIAGGSYKKVSPGVGDDGVHDKFTSGTRCQLADDECGWLQVVEKVPTASVVVGLLATAIQKAVQHDISIHVVTAYLEFLKHHLTDTSLACTIALLIMRRKVLATSLILGSSSNLIPPEFAGENWTATRSATVDLILGTLRKALESGTENDVVWDELNSVESPIVTLVTPRVALHAKELAVRRVRLHQVIVDAALEVLSLLGQHSGEVKRKEEAFQDLLNVIFPAYDTEAQPWGWDLEVPTGWIEDTGVRKPLFSEAQAVNLIRTEDIRLVKAGLSVLSVESKLELFEGFGLSSAGTIVLLEDLNTVPNMRLESILGSFSRQRLEKLTSCVRTFVRADNKVGRNMLRLIEKMCAPSAPTSSTVQQTPTSFGLRKEKTAFVGSGEAEKPRPKRSLEEITESMFKWLLSVEEVTERQISYDMSLYLQFREELQKVLALGSIENIKSVIGIVLVKLESAEESCFGNQKFVLYGLPVLVLLSNAPCFEDRRKQPSSVKGLLSIEPRADMGHEKRDISYPAIMAEALILCRELQTRLFSIYTNLTGNTGYDLPSTRKYVLSGITGGFSTTLDMVEKAPVGRFEALLRLYMCRKLQWLWRGRDVGDRSALPPLANVMAGLLRKWRLGSGQSDSRSGLTSLVDMKSQIVFSGRCGLVMEMLTMLDPEFDSEDSLTAVFDLPEVQRKLEESVGPSLPAIGLSYVVHKCSWKTLSKVFQQLFCKSWSTEKGQFSVEGSEKVKETPGIFSGLEHVIEFISLCVQHPRAKLACRASIEVEPYMSSTNLASSWLDKSSAVVLTKIAVSAYIGSKLGSAEIRKSTPHVSVERHVHALERRTLSPTSRALKLLAIAVYQGPDIMRAVVQHLSSYEDTDSTGGLVVPSQSVALTYKAVARSLLWSLYLIFPVAVKTNLLSSCKRKLPTEDMRNLLEITEEYKQTCSLNSVIHTAVWTFCSGNEKDSNAAYAFCQEFSRQHPLLLLPYLPTLKILLKEVLPQLKQGEPQARRTMSRVLWMGLGLLDMLRPHVIQESNSMLISGVCPPEYNGPSTHCPASSKGPTTKSGLEGILDLYFEVLKDVDAQDRPHFAKVVARFADFLCHCVAAGGRIREYVSANRAPVLDTTAQAFGKIKKMGFLLSLLDKPGTANFVDEIPVISFTSSSAGVNSQVASLPIPLDQVLAVRGQLQQCIKLHSKDSWKAQRMEFYSTEKAFGHMDGDVEDWNLSATLTDVDKASARVPALLSVLEDSLVQLISEKDSSLRERIYALLERTLVHCPSENSASNIVGCLLQQLKSSDVPRAKSAARNASRFFHFSTALQETMLIEMLQLGRIASDDLQQLIQGVLTCASAHGG
ncbi:hypothetical protein R1flu_007748 [Riccia fluitans]|uniref:Uncharacterized protein n=1 Tax=Riccia fluitans TaxID=41844 RepID=A0ABD1Z0Y1_9MARC